MPQDKLLKESDYALAWFLFWICTTVGGAVAGMVAGGIVGAVMAAAGVHDNTAHMVGGGIAGFLVGIPVSYGFFRLYVARIIVKRITDRTAELGTVGRVFD